MLSLTEITLLGFFWHKPVLNRSRMSEDDGVLKLAMNFKGKGLSVSFMLGFGFFFQ